MTRRIAIGSTASLQVLALMLALSLVRPRDVQAAEPTAAGAPAPAALRNVLRLELSKAPQERFVTHADQSLEILLSNGGSIVLAPLSVLVIGSFKSDTAGGLRVTLDAGAARLIAGPIGSRPIVVHAAGAQFELAAGGAYVAHDAPRVRAALLFGGPLEATCGGDREAVHRPGFEIVSAGSGLCEVRKQASGQAYQDAQRLNPGLATGGVARVRLGSAAEADAGGAEADAGDQGSLMRSEVLLASVAATPEADLGLSYAVNLPNGAKFGTISASSGAMSSNGSSSTADGSIDVVLTQDSHDFLSEAIATNFFNSCGSTCIRQRSHGISANRTLPSLSGEYAISPTAEIGSVVSRGTENLTYAISTTLGFEAQGFANDTYINIDVDQVTNELFDSIGEIFQLTLFANTIHEEDFDAQSSLVFKGRRNGSLIVRAADTSGDFHYFTKTRGFRRDTVFAITSSPGSVRETMSGHALAVPFEMVFGPSGYLISSQLDRNLALSGSPTLTDAVSLSGFNVAGFNENFFAIGDFFSPPESLDEYASFVLDTVLSSPMGLPAGSAAFSVGNPPNLGVRGLSAGFLSAGEWPFLPDLGDGTLALAVNPRGNDNFVMLEVEDVDGRIVNFAAGDVGGGRSGRDGVSLDSFVLSRGLNPADFSLDPNSGLPAPRSTQATQDFRSLLPSSSLPSSTRAFSTPLLVLNTPPTSNGDMTSRVFQADFYMSPDGAQTSISTTLGTVDYDTDGYGNLFSNEFGTIIEIADQPDPRTKVKLNGQTIGASQLTEQGGGQSGPSLFSSGLVATAIGGGNTWSDGGKRAGYAGYLVLENVSNDARLATFNDTPQGNAATTQLTGKLISTLTSDEIFGIRNVTGNTNDIAKLNDYVSNPFSPPALQSASSADLIDLLDAIYSVELVGLSDDQLRWLKGELPFPQSLEGFSDVEIKRLAAGGTAHPLGNAEEGYGLLRLAAGMASEPIEGTRLAARDALNGDFSGFVAGLHQIEGGAVDGLYFGELALGIDSAAATVAATVVYQRPAAQPLASGAAIGSYEQAGPLRLGTGAAVGGASAYVEPGVYGASVLISAGENAALLAGDSLKAGLGANRSDLIGKRDAGGIVINGSGRTVPYEHVQWGFFFGDLMPQAGARTHTALSTWAAGRRHEPGWGAPTNSSVRGVAGYAGHVIGTVVNQSAVYTAVGEFKQNWNLDARTGSMDMRFDSGSYSGSTLAPAIGPGLAYAGTLDEAGGTRRAGIRGELVAVTSQIPSGTIGRFEVRGLDASYQANGTFAGDGR